MGFLLGILFFLILMLMYVFVIVYTIFSIFISRRFDKVSKVALLENNVGVTVIVPFRNEAANLKSCIDGLKAQKNVELELVFVDDHSDDNSKEIIRQYGNGLNYRILESENEGKKAAILCGLKSSSNEIVYTTDSDCRLSESCLSEMLSYFHQNHLNMLCGLIEYESDDSVFEQLQQAESAALVGISATMLNSGYPATCNGASLMFRKSLFVELGGYGENIAISSGDDDLLMQRFAEFNLDKVEYFVLSEAKVFARSESDFRKFIHQRARWAGKRRQYLYSYNFYLMLMLAFKIIIFLVFLTLTLIHLSFWFLLPVLLLYLADYLMAKKFRTVLNFKIEMVLLMPFYQLYVPLAMILDHFGAVTWKGRLVTKSK